MASRFHALPAAQQAKIFANKKLFALWQKEKFSIEKMIVSRNGMQLPMTYAQALANLEKMGAVSHPNIGIAYKTGLKKPGVSLTAKDKELIGIMDPKDRLNGGAVAMRDIDTDLLVEMKSKHGQSLFGMGDDVRDVVAPDVLDDALAQLHGVDPADAFWYDFNEYARRLGIARRKAADGSWYFVPMRGKVDEVVKALAPKKVAKTIAQMEKEAKGWAMSLSQEERDALALWTGGDYSRVRGFQLGTLEFQGLSAAEKKRVGRVFDSLLAAFNRAPKYEGTVWRGLSGLSDEVYKNFLSQDIITFKAFSSSTVSEAFGTGYVRGLVGKNVLLEIRSKSGVLIQNVSIFEGEREVLFAAGSRFRKVSMKDKKKTFLVDLGAAGGYVKRQFSFIHLILEEI